MSDSTIELIYVGDGSFIAGVPARDLTAAEAHEFGQVITEQQAATGMTLYAPKTHKPAKRQDKEVDNG
jgi:hypothetical protein